MGSSFEDWSGPEVPRTSEDPRIRARREEVAAAARITRLRKVGLVLVLLGVIVLTGSLGGLLGTAITWWFSP